MGIRITFKPRTLAYILVGLVICTTLVSLLRTLQQNYLQQYYFPVFRSKNVTHLGLNCRRWAGGVIGSFHGPGTAEYPKDDWTRFKPVMTAENKAEMLQTLKVFTDTLDKHGVKYFLYVGSLIGSYRHHGFIPWDDDIDIAYDISQRDVMFPALHSLAPDYLVGYRGFPKFYRNDTTRLSMPSNKRRGPFRNKPDNFTASIQWPYIDMFYFVDNGSHICLHGDRKCLPRDFILPLKKRPFECLVLPVPRDLHHMFRVMAPKYEDVMTECRAIKWNHRHEKRNSEGDMVPCEKLTKIYPFVVRKRRGDSVVETLSLDGKALQQVTLPAY